MTPTRGGREAWKGTAGDLAIAGLTRRSFLSVVAGTGTMLVLAGCSGDADADSGGDSGSETKLTIGDPDGQLAVTLSTPEDELGFKPEYANLSGGSEVTEAFRAHALDVGSVGGIPSIQATATGLPVKIIALRYRVNPAYSLATSPDSGIETLDDIKGKKIAYSSGQESGLFVLKALKLAGLTAADVELVNLTSDKYFNAISSNQVDAAPFSEPNLTRYVDQFKGDGAIALNLDIESTPTTLTAPVEVLDDPDKFEALKQYVLAWQRGFVWAWENPDEWVEKYYVEQEGVDAESGERIVEEIGAPLYPKNFDRAKEIEEDALGFLVEEGVVEPVDVEDLFDERFEGLIDDSVTDYVEK